MVGSGHPRAGELAHDALDLGERLRPLPRLDFDPAGERLERVRVEAPDLAIGDEESPILQRPEAAGEQAAADVDGVIARRASPPGQPGALGQGAQREQRRQGTAHELAVGRQDGVGE